MKRIIKAATESNELQAAKAAMLAATKDVIDDELSKLIEKCESKGIKVKFIQDIPSIKSSCMSIVTELVDKYSKKLSKQSQSRQDYCVHIGYPNFRYQKHSSKWIEIL